MNLVGNVTIGTERYYMYVNDVKASVTYALLSPYHEDYYYHNDQSKPYYSDVYSLCNHYDEGYVAECVNQLKVSGRVKYSKGYSTIENLFGIMSFARNYTFKRSCIIKQEQSVQMGELYSSFSGKDGNLTYEIDTVNGLMKHLVINTGDVSISLDSIKSSIPVNKMEFIELKQQEKKKILISSLKTITLQTLQDHLDMSWYVKDGVSQKNYRTIKTISEFEEFVMKPILEGIKSAHEKGETFYVSLDTETTGLNIYNLAKDNESRDYCVAIPLSWSKDQGVVVFTDMEHFHNIPNQYAWSRLASIFERFSGEREIPLFLNSKPSVEQTPPSMEKMTLFFDPLEDDLVSLEPKVNQESKPEVYTIERSWVELVGHNVMFDKRVGIGEGYYIWFDHDTLQMSFNLYPTTVKGFNKLKGLTRRIFGHETPELTDILGKGNEDKYRYLVDEEVAKIYGCADGDYTLQVFFFLKKLMPPRLYAMYRTQDIPLLNILPKSEYYGLQTVEEKLKKLASDSAQNLENLRQFIYDYVGSFVDYYQRRNIVEARNKVGYYKSDEEYKAAISSIEFRTNVPYIFDIKASEIRKVMYDILKYPILGYTPGKNPLPKTDKVVLKKLQSYKRSANETGFKALKNDLLITGADPVLYNKLKNSSNPSDQKKAKSMVLISAKQFNKLKYPLAYVLSEYAALNKEYVAYFKPILEENLEGKIFKGYSLARIETRRISNPVQTMKGNLKALVKAYSDDYYLLDFDMSQVEYRIMLSLAKHMLMVERMKDPERDYHTETAALINGIQPHKVDPKTRKKAKKVSFGVPYGLSVFSLAEDLFGEANDETMFLTRMLLAKWEESNSPIMDFLNKVRDDALVARSMSEELRNFADAWEKDANGDYKLDANGEKIPTPIGITENRFGFYRPFVLAGIDFSDEALNRRSRGIFKGEESKIRRPAGNYPIQSFAAELFRIILIRFYERCEEEGINDKIIWHMLIHDELLCSVHKSLHPFYIYKIVKESCMVTMKGHTKYFVGINIGTTWAETKDDAREAPVYFVERAIKRWDAGEFGSGPFWFDDPWEELIKGERAQYVEDRIHEVVKEYQPNVDSEPINVPLLLEKFSNYTVSAYVKDYPVNGENSEETQDGKEIGILNGLRFDLSDEDEKNEYQDRIWASRLESWALNVYGEGKQIIDYDDNLCTIQKNKCIVEKKAEVKEETVDYAELFNDDYFSSKDNWSFDEKEVVDIYDSDSVVLDEEQDDSFFYNLDTSKRGSNIAQLLVTPKQYNNLKVLDKKIVITVDDSSVSAVQQYLQPNVAKTGNLVIFSTRHGLDKWLHVKSKLDLDELDKKIDSIRKESQVDLSSLKNIQYRYGKAIIPYVHESSLDLLTSTLKRYSSDSGISTLLQSSLGKLTNGYTVPPSVLLKLDKVLEERRL